MNSKKLPSKDAGAAAKKENQIIYKCFICEQWHEDDCDLEVLRKQLTQQEKEDA